MKMNAIKIKEFDYYIYVDYSENLIGYTIIEKKEVKDLLLKISRFRHYRKSKNRKIYLKHIKSTIHREGIKSYFKRIKIKSLRDNMEIFLDVLEFIKKHDNCIIFVCIDDYQFKKFRKMVRLIDGGKTKIIKESQLKKGSDEYKLSLVLDNLLNIERRSQ